MGQDLLFGRNSLGGFASSVRARTRFKQRLQACHLKDSLVALPAMAFLPGLPPTVVNPRGSAALIFMHGLGDTGRRDNFLCPAQSFASISLLFVRMFNCSSRNLSMLASAFRLPNIKFIFPTAPTRRVTINGGASMPGTQVVSL